MSFTLKTTQQSEREIDCLNKFKYSHYPLEKKSSEQYLLHEMYPYSAFFQPVFCHIRTEYGEILRERYLVRMRENADPKMCRIRTLFTHYCYHSVTFSYIS